MHRMLGAVETGVSSLRASMGHQLKASTYLDVQPCHGAMPYSMLFHMRA